MTEVLRGWEDVDHVTFIDHMPVTIIIEYTVKCFIKIMIVKLFELFVYSIVR